MGRATQPDPRSEQESVTGLVSLAERVQQAAIGRRVTVAAGESCTGGLVGHLLTEVPGSSEYFLGSVVSYADAAKRDLLEVPAPSLERHGAVSAQVAVAMAEGARRTFRADVGIAVTGIAGPSGATESKPVGLTYVATADARGHDVRRYTWSGDRSANKAASARAALELLLERLEQAE